MKARRDSLPSKYENSEKTRFQKECKNTFSCQSRSKHVADKARIHCPVRAKLKLHDDACRNSDGKANRIQRCPESCSRFIDWLSLPEEHPFEIHEDNTHPNRQRREQIMEHDGERKLQAGKRNDINHGRRPQLLNFKIGRILHLRSEIRDLELEHQT